MANPLVDQGVLNRLAASVVLADFPELNVTPSYLGKEGVSLSLEGNGTTYIGTMTGGVPSPEPYQVCSVTIHLLKSQPLSAQFKDKYESSTLIGNITVRPDVNSGLTPYDIVNCSLMNVREQSYAGTDAGWVITITGYYLINSQLYG